MEEMSDQVLAPELEDAREAIDRHAWKEAFELLREVDEVRIGVHATDAAESDGKYRGKGVHEAARIAALAGGGEIVASARSVDDDGVAASEPRSLQLKGISEPIEVVTIDWR